MEIYSQIAFFIFNIFQDFFDHQLIAFPKMFMNFTIQIINKYLILDCDSFVFLGRNGSDFPQPSCVVAETWTKSDKGLLQQTHPESRESQAKIVVCSW